MPFQGCNPDDDDDDCDTCLVAYKPNIYIHSPKNVHLVVKIDFPVGGEIIKSAPRYDNGWDIHVDTTGLINNFYTYLFYESKQPDIWQKDFGWIIKRDDLEIFFRTNLAEYGFFDQEIKDFVSYWIPRLNDFAYYCIYPQTAGIINNAIKLSFSEEPDSTLRLFYAVKGYNSLPERKLTEPKVIRFEGSGFFVTEWGVVLE